MSKPLNAVAFIVNGEPTATISPDGKLQLVAPPELRVEQLDNRADLGKQAWIDLKFGRPDDCQSGIAG